LAGQQRCRTCQSFVGVISMLCETIDVMTTRGALPYKKRLTMSTLPKITSGCDDLRAGKQCC
jgi:hypothetical protein